MSFLDNFLNSGSKKKKAVDDTTIQEIPLDQIIPNVYQPRQEFDKKPLEGLADSIKENGLLQPIVVRQNEDDKYEIIAGERRYRAVKSLQWEKIPAIVRKYTDKQSASLALIENLQRKDLNPIEEAQAYQHLSQMNNFKQKELAEKVGKSQSYVANKIRLLKLAPEVQTELANGSITQRHGRALLSLNQKQQVQFLHKIMTQNWNVSKTEKEVKKLQDNDAKPKKRIKALRSNNANLSRNTVRQSLKLAQKNGANFTFDETDSPNEYEIVIKIKKEDQRG